MRSHLFSHSLRPRQGSARVRGQTGIHHFAKKSGECRSDPATHDPATHDARVDVPKRTVDLEAIDAAVARRYRVKAEELKTLGYHAGPGKAVAAIGRRMADRPEVRAVVETLSRQLRNRRT